MITPPPPPLLLLLLAVWVLSGECVSVGCLPRPHGEEGAGEEWGSLEGIGVNGFCVCCPADPSGSPSAPLLPRDVVPFPRPLGTRPSAVAIGFLARVALFFLPLAVWSPPAPPSTSISTSCPCCCCGRAEEASGEGWWWSCARYSSCVYSIASEEGGGGRGRPPWVRAAEE